MSLIKNLFRKTDTAISRDDALAEMSSVAAIAAFICRLGYILLGLQVVVFIALSLFVLIPGWFQGQFHFVSDGSGDLLYQSLDGTFHIGWIEDGRLWISWMLSTIFLFLTFSRATQFFKHISQSKKPFERARAGELKRIGAMLVLSCLVPDLVGIVTLWLMRPLLAGLSYSVSFLTQSGQLAVGIVVFVFARVFEYGCILQEQDDGLL